MPQRKPGLQDILAAVAASVARLPRPYEREAQGIVAAALIELNRDLEAWLLRADGADRFTAQRYRSMIMQLRTAFDALQERVGSATSDQLAAAAPGMAELSASNLRRATMLFSERFGLGSPPALDQAARIAVGENVLMRQFESGSARYAGRMRRDIERSLAVGMVRGETFSELTTRLQRQRGPRGPVALRGIAGAPGAVIEVIPEGLFRRYRFWAERLVRTELMQAYNQQHIRDIVEHNKEDPGYRLRWDASNDKRTCSICRALDGQVVDVGQPWDGLAAGAGRAEIYGPPVHPRCRCVVVPWREEWGNAKATEVARRPARKSRLPKYEDVPATDKGTRRMLRGPDLDMSKFTMFDKPIQATSEERLESIRDLYRQGRQNEGRGVVVAILPNGTYEVIDGRHRLLVAPEFPEQKLRVTFVRGV